MAIYFQASTSKSYLDPGGEKKYIARPANRQKADFRMISEMIGERSTLTSADIIAVLYAFAEVVPELLLNNYSVHLPPLGIFSISLKSKVHDSPSEVEAGSIREIRIQFRPDKELSKKVNMKKQLKKMQ
ncbi:MAG: hypothetical protein EOM06_12440 [Sphingobacteriia bacterium]|nr:hypothetical protein [Sphingobacteriia bacterium]